MADRQGIRQRGGSPTPEPTATPAPTRAAAQLVRQANRSVRWGEEGGKMPAWYCKPWRGGGYAAAGGARLPTPATL